MIYIDIEMPERCSKCNFCIHQKTNDYGDFGECLLQNHKKVDCLVWNRDINCPLKEQEPITKNDSADKCIDRWDISGKEAEAWIVNGRLQIRNRGTIHNIDLSSVTSQEPTDKCKWIKYDHRTMCPKEHIDVDSPYWRIPENRMETLKYCPYCGKEIEV